MHSLATMIDIQACLCCQGVQHRLLFPSTFDGDVGTAHHYFLANRRATAHGDIRVCSDCGFVFTSPQFSESGYGRIYSQVGAVETSDQSSSNPGVIATARRFRRLKSLIGKLVDTREPFVNFGCGDGAFLAVVGQSHGKGFEVGPPGRRPGPAGSTILGGRWADVVGSPEIPDASQAFVTAFDVFEHLPCLERDILAIRRVLRPRGHLFMTIPDVGSVVARLTGRRWNMLLLEHLWYFNGSTLDRLMQRLGFVRVAQSSVPYDAALGHALKRLGETFGVKRLAVPGFLGEVVLPIPAGVLYAAYRRSD